MGTLRQPLSKPLLLAVTVMVGLSLFIFTNTLREWNDVQRVVTRSELVATISDLVHQLQIERGISAFYLGSLGNELESSLKSQHEATDAIILRFKHNTIVVIDTQDSVLIPAISTTSSSLQKLNGVRQNVTNRRIFGSASFFYYSELINHMLTLQQELSQHALQRELHDRIMVLRELTILKERTGQIRAIGSEGFASGMLTPENYRLLMQLIGIQNDRLTNLLSVIPSNRRGRLETIYNQPEVATVVELQGYLLDDGLDGTLQAANAKPWFNAMTLHINQYKKVEDELTDALLQHSTILQNQMGLKLAFLVTVLISVLSVTLVGLWRGQSRSTRERNALQNSLQAEQERSQQILESMSDAVCVVGHSGDIEYANPAMIKAFGSDAFRQMARDILPCVGSSGCALTPTGMEGNKQNKCEETFSPITGRGYAIHCAPFRNLDGLASRLVVLTDVTTHILAEQRLIEAKNAAESANRTKSEILANMSHELRTPLNAIIGFSDIMLNDIFGALGNDRYSECAKDIHSSGLHLLELINDILDVSAIEAGKVELQNDETDINQIIEAALRLIRNRADKGRVSLGAELSDDLPILFGDMRRLKQIMLNLLSNAVKFTPEKGAVTISTKTDAGGAIKVVVEDTGTGMSKKEIAKAMEPFGQADSGLNRKHEGTGLGLPLTVGLIELHEGTIEIESLKGTGTTIVVTFPPERSIIRSEIEVDVAEISSPEALSLASNTIAAD